MRVEKRIFEFRLGRRKTEQHTKGRPVKSICGKYSHQNDTYLNVSNSPVGFLLIFHWDMKHWLYVNRIHRVKNYKILQKLFGKKSLFHKELEHLRGPSKS